MARRLFPRPFKQECPMKARLFVCVLGALLVPAIAFAQASVTGTVRDASGAVVPGVTVEAASPALIEKVRVVTTDGTGQYRVVDLRPGTYTVTFTLPGFATVRREGVELTGNFTATVNAEIGVAALEQAITVTGQAPIVDVQSTTHQRVMTSAVMDALPTGRRFSDLGVLIPGVSSTNPDVGGLTGPSSVATLSIHGSLGQDQRVMIGGLSITNLDSLGGFAMYTPNPGSSQEITFDTSGASAEY